MIQNRRGQSEAESKLNKQFAAVFRRGAGKNVLNYLKQISIYDIGGPNMTSEHLFHKEGQRFIVAEIERRIQLGKETGDANIDN